MSAKKEEAPDQARELLNAVRELDRKLSRLTDMVARIDDRIEGLAARVVVSETFGRSMWGITIPPATIRRTVARYRERIRDVAESIHDKATLDRLHAASNALLDGLDTETH